MRVFYVQLMPRYNSNTLDLGSAGVHLDFRPSYWLSWLELPAGLAQSLQPNSGYYLQMGHNFLLGISYTGYSSSSLRFCSRWQICCDRLLTNPRFVLYVKWVPVTTAWRVFRLRMEETASRYGGWLRLHWLRSQEQPGGGGRPDWRLGGGI